MNRQNFIRGCENWLEQLFPKNSMTKDSQKIMLLYGAFCTLLLSIFFIHLFRKHPIIEADLPTLIFISFIFLGFWFFSVQVRFIKTKDPLEMGSWFFIAVLLVKGPTLAIVSYFFGATLYYFLSRLPITLGGKIGNVVISTLTYALSVSSVLFLFNKHLTLNQPLYAFIGITLIVILQTFLMTIFSAFYASLKSNEKFWRYLPLFLANTKTLNVTVSDVIFSPGFGLLAALLWHYKSYGDFPLLFLCFLLMRKATQREQDIQIFLGQSVAAQTAALDARDPDTANHSLRVARMAEMIGSKMGLEEADRDVLTLEGSIHDIGKLYIPDSILQKTGKYTVEEKKNMERHTHLDSLLLRHIPKEFAIWDWANIGRLHHEWWNGEGYPFKLKGDEIPLNARILAVADVWDALTSKRKYKEAWPDDKTLQYLQDGAGKQFDPACVNAFIQCYKDGDIQRLREGFEQKFSHNTFLDPCETESMARDEEVLIDRVREIPANEAHHWSFQPSLSLRAEFSYQRETEIPWLDRIKGTIVAGLNKNKNMFFFFLGICFFFFLNFFQIDPMIRNFCFFGGLLLSLEFWKIKPSNQLSFFMSDIIWISCLFIFPFPIFCALLALIIFAYFVLRPLQKNINIFALSRRFLLFIFSSYIFERWELYGNTTILDFVHLASSSKALTLFIAWMEIYAIGELFLLHVYSLIYHRRPAVLSWLIQMNYLFYTAVLFPLLGLLSYRMYVTKGLYFPYLYFAFILFLNRFYFSLKEETDSLQIGDQLIKLSSQETDKKFGFLEKNSENVAHLVRLLGIEMYCIEEEIEIGENAASLHDIGNLGIPDALLQTNQVFSVDDRQRMRPHPLMSVKILSRFPIYTIADTLVVVKSHHERWDGRGYPYGLKGRKIPFWSRVLAVSDAAIAMRFPRPDRAAIPFDEMITEIKKNSGSQFDPDVVQAFEKLASEGKLDWLR